MNLKIVNVAVGGFLFFILSACSESNDTTATPVITVSAGEMIVKKNCKVCHAQGINGAPVLGNKKMWSERKLKPLATLVNNASNGFGLMPAKGGNTKLTEEQITEAISYMLSLVD